MPKGGYIRKTARYNGKQYEAYGTTELEAMTKLADKLAAAKTLVSLRMVLSLHSGQLQIHRVAAANMMGNAVNEIFAAQAAQLRHHDAL